MKSNGDGRNSENWKSNERRVSRKNNGKRTSNEGGKSKKDENSGQGEKKNGRGVMKNKERNVRSTFNGSNELSAAQHTENGKRGDLPPLRGAGSRMFPNHQLGPAMTLAARIGESKHVSTAYSGSTEHGTANILRY